MRDGNGRFGLGLAALAAVAIPFAVIAVLDPRIGLLRPRPAGEAAQAPLTAPADAPARRPPREAGADEAGSEARTSEAKTSDTKSPDAPTSAIRPSNTWTESPGRPCPICTATEPAPPIRGTLPDPDIQIPDVAAERAAQRARLIGWTAHPDRVSGSATALDLIGLVFTAPREAGAGYRPLAIDLAGAPDRAVVVVTEQPVTLAVTSVPPDRAGALGVESSAAFGLADGRSGLLAGFRALPYGAAAVAPVLDPLRFGPGTLRGFCAALRLWALQFGLPTGRTRYTLIENPTRIALAGEALQTDGTARGRVSGRRLARLCRV
ncbi:hypothetical protein [Methylobacterium platani]|uniref:Uncharacterized protein n=2 Tax=Methylobacterium platani TaxID=427683 RepID=A0A179S1D5_9HYPH|nr:hypothetical protein [Methylobacterium platani]KMO16382.1 hypothetical protein SQ03_14725 [Methylobacterium platani JCM 14648]OAS19382.1 hypothetical protein A5481_25150 [Methylobacterium platani]